jgi:hypothetical protein
LEFFEHASVVPDSPRERLTLQTKRRKQSRRFTDIPLNMMYAVRTIGDMSDTQVLTAGDEVLHTDGNQGTERNLKRPASQVQIPPTADPWVEIDAIASDTDAVAKDLRPIWA